MQESDTSQFFDRFEDAADDTPVEFRLPDGSLSTLDGWGSIAPSGLAPSEWAWALLTNSDVTGAGDYANWATAEHVNGVPGQVGVYDVHTRTWYDIADSSYANWDRASNDFVPTSGEAGDCILFTLAPAGSPPPLPDDPQWKRP